jgi:hypothetical protein
VTKRRQLEISANNSYRLNAEGEAIGILEHLERIVGQPDTLPSTSDVGSIGA